MRNCLTMIGIDDIILEERIGDSSAEAMVFKGRISDPISLNLPNPDQIFAFKIYYNYGGSRTRTLKRNHQNDLDMMFSLGSHPNVMHGYFHFLDILDLNYATRYMPISRNDVPFIFEQLTINPIKIEIVIMPYHSRSLKYFLVENDDIPIDFVLRIILDISRGLRHLCEYNYAHCDIKPDNLLMDDEDRVILIDFGLCTRFGKMSQGGNPLYSSPESSRDEVSEKTDVFSIGCLFYLMLSNQHPFEELSPNFKWRTLLSENIFPFKKDHPRTMFNASQLIFPPHLNKKIQDLIRGMIEPAPVNRLNFNSVVSVLEEI